MSVTVNIKAADGATTTVVLPDPIVQSGGGTGAHYVATLTLGSTVYTFDSNNAVDQGDYVGQFVQQKSLMVSLANCPFTVFFRPDVDGNRDEVVVELGKMWSGTPTHVTTPYTFAVTKNGASLFTQSVPYHWWWARWRWQSAPRPFVRDAASLIADGHFLPHTTAYLYGYTAWSTNITYSVMGTAGIDVAMGDTGDRPELGPLTLAQSDYILLGTELARTSMIAQAEASATMAFHFRDENTGAWLDNRAHPYYSMNPASDPPIIPHPPAPGSGEFFLDSSHMPSLCYAPFLFTDDPYYLEEIQAMALYHIVETNYHQITQGLRGLVYPGQTRATAWGVRTVAQCAKVTPVSVPSWLLPQSLQLANLADNRTFLQRYQNAGSRMQLLFHEYSISGEEQAFMTDYLMICLAWLVRMGFTEWADGYQWAMGAVMPLVTDGSGWLKGWPCPYWYFTRTDSSANNPAYTVYVSDTSLDSVTYPSWAALFQRYVADHGNTNDPTLTTYPPPWDGVSIMQTQSNAGYFLWRQGSLHLAEGLGITGAASANTWLDGQIPKQIVKYGSTNDPRWSFAETP